MASDDEIRFESPFIRVYNSGRVERLFPSDFVPPSTDPATGVSSKDVAIHGDTGVSARLYLPTITDAGSEKLPLVIYYHGGAFCLGSAFDSLCQNYLTSLASEFNVIIVSVDYRLAPEHPLPTAYEDSWQALQWVASHAHGGSETWLADHADFNSVFLAGDSAGANIVHHMAMRAGAEPLHQDVQIEGIVLMHPYFMEAKETKSNGIKEMEKLWKVTCPSTIGLDDNWINPMANGAPSLKGLASRQVLVCVAEKDVLGDGGKSYYERLIGSGWAGEGQIFETQGEGHMFHVFNPTSEKTKIQTNKISCFLRGL